MADDIDKHLLVVAAGMMKEPEHHEITDSALLASKAELENYLPAGVNLRPDEQVYIPWLNLATPMMVHRELVLRLAAYMAQIEVANIHRIPLGTFTWKPYWMSNHTEFGRIFTNAFMNLLLDSVSFNLFNCHTSSANGKISAQHEREMVQWALENRIFHGPAERLSVAASYFNPKNLSGATRASDEQAIAAQHLIPGSLMHEEVTDPKHTSQHCLTKGTSTIDKVVNNHKQDCTCYLFGFARVYCAEAGKLYTNNGNIPTLYYSWRYTSDREKEVQNPWEAKKPIQNLNSSGMLEVTAYQESTRWRDVSCDRQAPLYLNFELANGREMYKGVTATLNKVYGGAQVGFRVGARGNPGLMLMDWRASFVTEVKSRDSDEEPEEPAGPLMEYVSLDMLMLE